MDGLAWGAEGSLGAPFTVCGGALRLWGLWACVWEVMGPGWTPRQPARRPQRLVFGQSNPEGLGDLGPSSDWLQTWQAGHSLEGWSQEPVLFTAFLGGSYTEI